MKELNQTELMNVTGGCSCICACKRGGDFWQAPMGDTSSPFACSSACDGLTHGDRSCSMLACS